MERRRSVVGQLGEFFTENENDSASGVEEDDLVVHEGLEGLVYSDDSVSVQGRA